MTTALLSPGTPAHKPEPTAKVYRHLGFSWIWLLPIGALLLVAYLAYTLFSERGPVITITFKTADGLTARQTQVKYKAVTLGTVESIALSEDRSHVVVSVRMSHRATKMLSSNSRFWVVRPRFNGGLSAVSTGLETLVSGAYVALDPGVKMGTPEQHFTGLEEPPSVRSDEPGTVFTLEAAGLGGLGAGAPIYYREVSVGEVLSYELDPAGSGVKLRVFVREPYARSVVAETRFWNSSGIRVDTDAGGLHIELQSLESLLSGGIAFQTPPDALQHAPSPANTTFRLYANQAQAEMAFYPRSTAYVSYFQSSVRGLAEGSEVNMFGRRVGSVTEVTLVRDPRPDHPGELAARVAYVLQPDRVLGASDRSALDLDSLRPLVAERLRVVLGTSNLITGQKVLSLEYVPGAKPASVVREGDSWVLPSESDDIQDLSRSLAQIGEKINSIPFREIGENLNRTLASIERTAGGPELRNAIVSLDSTLKEVQNLARQVEAGAGPALARLPSIAEKLQQAVDHADAALGQNGYGTDSTVQRNLERMTAQIAEAARSVRLLADYLNRHPEAAVLGRGKGAP